MSPMIAVDLKTEAIKLAHHPNVWLQNANRLAGLAVTSRTIGLWAETQDGRSISHFAPARRFL